MTHDYIIVYGEQPPDYIPCNCFCNRCLWYLTTILCIRH